MKLKIRELCAAVLALLAAQGLTDDGTLTVNAATTVELLMVGGGAGGVIHKQALTLEPGTYSIVIGAGGDVSENGGDTKITGSSDFLLTAFGGGAGADWGGHPGGSGGSGGGSTLSDSSGLTDASAPNGAHVYRLR